MNKFVADRLYLNRVIEAASMRPSNDNAPATSAEEVIARRKTIKPSANYRKITASLAKRQSIGDPRAANDNKDWPLAEQLRRDGNEVLLRVAERYKHIYESAQYVPKTVGTIADEFWSPEQKHSINDKTGQIKNNGQKKSKTAASMPIDDGTYKAAAVTDDVAEAILHNGPVTFPRRPKMPVMGKWNGDAALIAAIDARPLLYRLQTALGPLMDPFEDAVIGGMTLTEIGKNGGIGQHASGAGKYAVMLGLQCIQSELTIIDRLCAA